MAIYKKVLFNGKITTYHRMLIEKYLGLTLNQKYVVHHIDKNPNNNKLSNLRIMTRSQHGKLHSPKPKYKHIKCHNCKKYFNILLRKFTFKIKSGQNTFYCSKGCHGNYRYKKHDKLIKRELKNGLSGYQIAQKHNLNKATVYNHIKTIHL